MGKCQMTVTPMRGKHSQESLESQDASAVRAMAALTAMGITQYDTAISGVATQFSRGFTLDMHIVRYMLEHAAHITELPVVYHPRKVGKHISAWDLPKILWAGIS